MVLSRVGLTGATGMLGRHLRSLLESRDVSVVASSRQADPGNDVIGWDLSTWLSPSELDAMFKDIQALVHVGAMLPGAGRAIEECSMFDANVRSCANLGGWAAEQNLPLLYVSGAIVYQDQERGLQSESAALGWNELGGFYGFTKLCGETVLRNLCTNGLKLAVVRPTSIYGYGLAGNKMMSKFLNSALKGHTIELYPPADDEIDFIHALDVSAAIYRILERESWDTFNLCSGKPLSVRALAEACVEVAGSGEVLLKDDASSSRAAGKRFALDPDKAAADLEWEAGIGITQGLGMMANKLLSDEF